jgi:phosphoribosylformimino-5-aminoimidazole carboxamide ribotide isomerase
MEIIPAIDLKGGKCVRLKQGRDDATTAYADDPVAVAREWKRQGARRLHVVNLDGAFGRESSHLVLVRNIVAAFGAGVQFGGGLRSPEVLDAAFETGIEKAVLGTVAFENRPLLRDCHRRYGADRLIIAIDGIGGNVATRGWTTVTSTGVVDLAAQLHGEGIGEILSTDISRDGMMSGPDIGTLSLLADIGLRVLASGGISSEADVRKLIALARPNLTGAIIGKALYEGAISLESVVRLADGLSGPPT